MKNLYWMGLCCLIAAASCTSSKQTTTWKATDIADQPYKKILVLGSCKTPTEPYR